MAKKAGLGMGLDALFGDNTDAFGFKALLDSTGIDVSGEKCTVLGSGGAAATVCAVLADAGAETVVVSRRGENNYSNLERHADTSLLVNTTPVGMYPDVGSSPVSLDAFPRLRAVIDLIYNPSPTKLLFEAERRGIPAAGGLLMLVAQAWKASEYFGRRGCGNIYLYGIIFVVLSAVPFLMTLKEFKKRTAEAER